MRRRTMGCCRLRAVASPLDSFFLLLAFLGSLSARSFVHPHLWLWPRLIFFYVLFFLSLVSFSVCPFISVISIRAAPYPFFLFPTYLVLSHSTHSDRLTVCVSRMYMHTCITLILFLLRPIIYWHISLLPLSIISLPIASHYALSLIARLSVSCSIPIQCHFSLSLDHDHDHDHPLFLFPISHSLISLFQYCCMHASVSCLVFFFFVSPLLSAIFQIFSVLSINTQSQSAVPSSQYSLLQSLSSQSEMLVLQRYSIDGSNFLIDWDLGSGGLVYRNGFRSDRRRLFVVDGGMYIHT